MIKAKKQLIDVIDNIEQCIQNRLKQSEEGLIYAEKLLSEDKKFDFTSMIKIHVQDLKNRIHALSPRYGLMVKLRNFNEEFKIFKCDIILDDQIDASNIGNYFIKEKIFYIICSDGFLIPQIIQKTHGSGKKISSSEFVNSFKL